MIQYSQFQVPASNPSHHLSHRIDPIRSNHPNQIQCNPTQRKPYEIPANKQVDTFISLSAITSPNIHPTRESLNIVHPKLPEAFRENLGKQKLSLPCCCPVSFHRSLYKGFGAILLRYTVQYSSSKYGTGGRGGGSQDRSRISGSREDLDRMWYSMTRRWEILITSLG